MKATPLVRERVVFPDGALIEIKIWRTPKPVPPSRHALKYSLFYGRAGQRLIGYDNERGKGDHRHLRSREENCRFRSIEQLLRDFRADVEALRGEEI
jgi:hypothetical protein